VRQELVPKVRAMTAHHLKVRKLLAEVYKLSCGFFEQGQCMF